MMQIRILKNIPIPTERVSPNPTGGTSKYLWDKLEIGDCMVVSNISTHTISSAISSRQARTHNKYTRRAINGEQWVWRIK